MGCSAISRVSYVKPIVPPLPEKPTYYSVPWGNGPYCLDEQGAKNLLKNRALDEDYINQLKSIIDSLR